jgi:hypothetical protein
MIYISLHQKIFSFCGGNVGRFPTSITGHMSTPGSATTLLTDLIISVVTFLPTPPSRHSTVTLYEWTVITHDYPGRGASRRVTSWQTCRSLADRRYLSAHVCARRVGFFSTSE